MTQQGVRSFINLLEVQNQHTSRTDWKLFSLNMCEENTDPRTCSLSVRNTDIRAIKTIRIIFAFGQSLCKEGSAQ